MPTGLSKTYLWSILLLLVMGKFSSADSSFAELGFHHKKAETQLRIVTYNHGLLNFKNPVRSVFVPFRTERSKAAPAAWSDFLEQHQPDAVLLQEIWYRKDYKRLEEAFRLRGYTPIVTEAQVPRYKRSFGIRGHGLQIFLRDKTLELVSGEFRAFTDSKGELLRTDLESLRVFPYRIDVQRGALLASVRVRGLEQPTHLTLLTTHLTSRLEDRDMRNAQIQNLSEILSIQEQRADSIVVGADFNISPSFEKAAEKDVEDYLSNAAQYSRFLENSGMVDSYRSAKRVEGYQFTQNRPHNVLARMGKSTKREPEQRLDFIFLKGAEARHYQTILSDELVRIRGRRAVKKVPLSDHFGVMVDLSL